MSTASKQKTLKVQCPFCHARLDLSDLPAFSQVSCPKCASGVTVPKWFQNILLEESLAVSPGLQVFRALDATLDRESCVKLMHIAEAADCPLPCSDSPYQKAQLDDFLETFRQMSLLVHPNIVPVCSCSAIDGAVYGITRYINAVPLNCSAGAAPPEWKLVQLQAAAALDALRYAHDSGLCHGHLTPSNMLIDQHGMLFISDFMVAHSVKKEIADEPWTAPELAAGQKPDCKSDLFSLAVCLYEFATGQLPCQDQLEEWRTGNLLPTAPKQLNPNLPENFSKILLRAMAISPDARFPSFAAMQAELSRLGKGPGRGWQRKQAHGRKLLLSKSSRQPQLRLLNSRRRKNHNPINIAISILLLIALVLAGLLLSRKQPVQDKLHQIGLLKDGKLNLQVIPKTNIPKAEEGPETMPEKESLPGFSLLPELIKARPRPANYDFKSVREQVQAYLARLPEEKRETERERIRYLASYKEYLLSKISKMAYSPANPSGIRLRNGELVSGNVTMFSNEKALKVRQNQGGDSNLREIPWEELPPNQMLEMAYSYVERNAAEIKGAKRIQRKKLEEVYDEFFYLILLADWYQEGDALKKFCQEAEQLPLAEGKEKLLQYIQWPN
jgi:serine/threonine protein kinase